MSKRYVPNPKHKEPWQPGRKGTLCRHGLDDAAYGRLQDRVQEMLDGGTACDGAIFHAFEGRAYKALPGQDDTWHGFPVGWKEVPEAVWRAWLERRVIRRADVQRHWTLGGAA